MEKRITKKLYPTTNLLLAIVLIISAFIVPDYRYSYFIFIICGVIVYFYGKLNTYLKQVFRSLILLFIFNAKTAAVENKGSNFEMSDERVIEIIREIADFMDTQGNDALLDRFRERLDTLEFVWNSRRKEIGKKLFEEFWNKR